MRIRRCRPFCSPDGGTSRASFPAERAPSSAWSRPPRCWPSTGWRATCWALRLRPPPRCSPPSIPSGTRRARWPTPTSSPLPSRCGVCRSTSSPSASRAPGFTPQSCFRWPRSPKKPRSSRRSRWRCGKRFCSCAGPAPPHHGVPTLIGSPRCSRPSFPWLPGTRTTSIAPATSSATPNSCATTPPPISTRTASRSACITGYCTSPCT